MIASEDDRSSASPSRFRTTLVPETPRRLPGPSSLKVGCLSRIATKKENCREQYDTRLFRKSLRFICVFRFTHLGYFSVKMNSSILVLITSNEIGFTK